MDLQNLVKAFLLGVFDSIRGLWILKHIDRDLNERAMNRLSQGRTQIRRRSSDTRENTPPRKILKKEEKSQVRIRAVYCCCLNLGVLLATVIFFEYGFFPLRNKFFENCFKETSFAYRMMIILQWLITVIIKTLWVLPLFIISKVVNSFWFQDIADSAYRYSRGKPQLTQSISNMISDILFSTLIQALFLVQTTLIGCIPIYLLGYLFSTVHMCFLYSLYAFEYKWFNMGWELHHRLSFIEVNWPYFLGFGLPLTVLTHFSSSIISACIFSATFPIFIISANEANPITGVCDQPLHLFSPVIKISNFMLSNRYVSRKIAQSMATPKR